MVDLAQLSALIVDAGSLDDDIDTVVQTANDSWVVRFDSVDIEIEVDDARSRLIIATTVGVPAEQRRMTVLEAALAFNVLLRETGGVRMALAGTDGDLVQIADVGIDGLTPTLLATVLANLASKTLVWRAFVASEDAAEPPAAETAGSVTFRA